MRSFIFLFIILSFQVLFLKTYSQNYTDVFNIGSSHSPYNKYKFYDNKVSLTESFASLKIPVELENKDIFMFGLNVNSILFDNEPPIDNNENYYSTSLEIGYTKIWNEKLSTLLVLVPGLYSDFKNITSEDYQIGGMILFTVIKDENLKYRFGLYYNRDFFGPFFIPMIGIDWRPSSNVQIFGNLPEDITFRIRLNGKLGAGFLYNESFGSYRLGEEYNKDYMQKYSNNFSFFLDASLTKNIVLTLKAGLTAGRYYRVYSENDELKMKIAFYNIGDNRLQLNDDFYDGYFYELKLAYRLWL